MKQGVTNRHSLQTLTALFMLLACQPNPARKEVFPEKGVALLVLGNAQDAGSPQIGCYRSCCVNLWDTSVELRWVSSLGVLDRQNRECYLFDASPNMPQQLHWMHQTDTTIPLLPRAIFLTHAHIGHYTGLMYLGREALGARKASVYAMPRMDSFLRQNGPWQQLVTNENIELHPLSDSLPVRLSEALTVIPLQVPHRDEYSETVGYRILGPSKSALFIPDIDKWERWNRSLIEEIQKVDYAFLDATFFDAAEIGFRDIREIPHPFVVETMQLLQEAPDPLRNKVWFIHMNHSNPMLDKTSEISKKVNANGFHIARKGDRFEL